MRVHLPKDIDINQVRFEEGTAAGGGLRVLRATYAGQPLVVQTPYTAFSLDEGGGVLTLKISEEDTVRRRNVKEFVSMLDAFDEKVRDQETEGRWPGTVVDGALSVPYRGCPMLNERNQRICSSEATPVATECYAKCAALLRCDGIWNVAGHAGIRWTPLAVQFRDPMMFREEDDPEKEPAIGSTTEGYDG